MAFQPIAFQPFPAFQQTAISQPSSPKRVFVVPLRKKILRIAPKRFSK